jgi:hypothetical protein
MMRLLREWKEALVIVKPETVVKWHRKGFMHYWRRKSRRKPGSPPHQHEADLPDQALSRENPTWGAPRIHDELPLLGQDVCETSPHADIQAAVRLRRLVSRSPSDPACDVTGAPSSEWTALQLTEAFPYDHGIEYLIHDGDGIYGDAFLRRLKALETVEAPSTRLNGIRVLQLMIPTHDPAVG